MGSCAGSGIWALCGVHDGTLCLRRDALLERGLGLRLGVFRYLHRPTRQVVPPPLPIPSPARDLELYSAEQVVLLLAIFRVTSLEDGEQHLVDRHFMGR